MYAKVFSSAEEAVNAARAIMIEDYYGGDPAAASAAGASVNRFQSDEIRNAWHAVERCTEQFIMLGESIAASRDATTTIASINYSMSDGARIREEMDHNRLAATAQSRLSEAQQRMYNAILASRIPDTSN